MTVSNIIRIQPGLDLGASSHIDVLHAAHQSSISLAVNAVSWNETLLKKNEAIERVKTMPLTGLDCYVSQQPFKMYSSRCVSNLSCLSSFYIDLDNYNTSYNAHDALDIFTEALNENPDLPVPTIVGCSGRGNYLVWTLDKTKPASFLPAWQQIEDTLIVIFQKYGADRQARDAARVLRIADTINTKNGASVDLQKVGEPVTFERMQRFCNAYRRKNKDAFPVRKVKTSRVSSLNNKNGYTLAYARMQDLRKLAELRGGKLTEHRRMTVFYYACAASWFCQSTLALESEVNDFIDQCIDVRGSYDSIIKSVMKRKNDSLNDITITWKGKDYDSRYRVRTSTILNALEITAEEQRELKNLINGSEKNRRRTEKRHAQGITKQTRGEYESAAKHKRSKAKELLKCGYSVSDVMDLLQVSRAWVYKYR